MDLSFQEKSILGSLIITAALFGGYFIKIIQVLTSTSSTDLASMPATLVAFVIAIVIVEAIYRLAIATVSKGEEEDERDKLISAKATLIAYYVLAAGCITTVGHILISVSIGESFNQFLIHPVLLANMIFFFFILSELVGFAMRLYYYRRGI